MEANEINNQQFAKFVNGQLSHKELVEVERELINTGEAIAALQAAIVNYRTRYAEAEEILGNDEIFFRRKAINGDETYSIVSKSSNNSSNMTLNFNQQEVVRINSILEGLNQSLDQNKQFADNLISFYLQQRPGTTPAEAREVFGGLRNGIMQFNRNFVEALNDSENGVDYVALINHATAEMSLHEKYDFMLNYLVALQTVSADNYDVNLNQIEGFNDLKGRTYQASGEVTEEMISELSEQIAEVMENSILVLPNAEALEALINNLHTGEAAIEAFEINSKEDIEHKLKVAMATYIAYKNNEISSIAGEEISPESIGIGVAAGMEQEKVLEEARSGRKPIDVVLKTIKIIGGIALFTGLLIAGAWLVANVVTLSAMALTSIFGVSVLGTIVSCGLAFFLVGWPLIKCNDGACETIINGADKLYDKLTQEWIPVALSWTGAKIKQFVAWLTNMREAGNVVNVDDETTSNQIVTQ